VIEINTVIYDAVKAGSIKNIRFFSDSMKFPPEPPYVVIKPEAGDGRVNFRIFVHFSPGQQDDLDRYIRYELSELMAEPKTITGNRRFKSTGAWEDTRTNNDDHTISSARTFYVPVIIT
jgi:hypothetical protein